MDLWTESIYLVLTIATIEAFRAIICLLVELFCNVWSKIDNGFLARCIPPWCYVDVVQLVVWGGFSKFRVFIGLYIV